MGDEPKRPLTWAEYVQERARADPHGISAEDKEVNEAVRSYWDFAWRWDDGSPVEGVFYYNFGAAMKAARKYNFLLPEQNVANHQRIKEMSEKAERAFSHKISWRHPAPRDDSATTTIM